MKKQTNLEMKFHVDHVYMTSLTILYVLKTGAPLGV